MKSKNTKLIVELKERSTELQATGLALQMRTEYRLDCEHIRGLLRPWLLNWKESSRDQTDDSHTDNNGVVWASMNWTSETDVQFVLKADGPNLHEVRWFIEKLADCHVAAESVNTTSQYTGERIAPCILESKMNAPSRTMIGMAMRALRQQRERSEYSAEKATRAWDAIWQAEQRLSIRETQSVNRSLTSLAA